MMERENRLDLNVVLSTFSIYTVQKYLKACVQS